MTLDDLEVFVAAAQAQNLSAVARELGCTQPAVSQHIARLEKELGCALLLRQPRGVALTEAGKLFYEHAVEGIGAIDFGVRCIRQWREGETTRLAISTGSTTVRHLMKDAVAEFRQSYPEVELFFQSANSHRRCIDALRNEQADLAFVTLGEPIRGFEQAPALTVPWVLAVPKEDPLTDKPTISLDDVSRLSCIRLKESSTSQGQLEAALKDAGVQLRSSAQVDDWDTAILLVGMGLGYAITPAIHAQKLAEQDGVAAIPIQGLPPVTFGWISRRWNAMPRVATEFVAAFRRALAGTGGHTADNSPLRVRLPG